MAVLLEIVKRIRDELLLWLLAIAVLAIIAGVENAGAVLIAVLAVGGTLVAIRILIEKRRVPMPLVISFDGVQPGEIRPAKCEYELQDNQNKPKGEGEMAFCREVNSWVCYLPRHVTVTDIIRIYITDGDGGKWETGPFRPLFNRAKAERVS